MPTIPQKFNPHPPSTFSTQPQSQAIEGSDKKNASNGVNRQNTFSSPIPKTLSLAGSRFNIGALKGRADSATRHYLAAVLNPDSEAGVTRGEDGRYSYNVDADHPEGSKQQLQINATVNDRGDLIELEVKRKQAPGLLIHAEFDAEVSQHENGLQLGNSSSLSLPPGAVFKGGPLPRHPEGEQYKTMRYMRSGKEPITLMGLRRPGGQVFDVYDATTHQSVDKLTLLKSGQSSKDEVVVDSSRARLPGGMRHLKRSAEGVKTSKSSPTGYKLASTGEPCDRHGGVASSSSSAAGASSVNAPSTSNVDPLSQMVSQHISLHPTQRANSAYANLIREALHGDGSAEHLNTHNAVYGESGGLSLPTTQALEFVAQRLDMSNRDEIRLSGFLNQLHAQASSGEPVSLPAYYHCTGDEGFESMMSNDQPSVRVTTPRTGTGGTGAWLSTSPETRAYGPYVMAFNHHLDLVHSTTHRSQGKATVHNVGEDLHIGIQEPISLRGVNSNQAEPPLSLIGVPAEEVEYYKTHVGQLNGNLHFSYNDGTADVAVFSTETVQKLAQLLNQINAKQVPRGW